MKKYIILLFLLFGLCFISASAQAYVVKDIIVNKVGVGVHIEIIAEGSITYQVFSLSSPPRIVVDLMNAVDKLPGRTPYNVNRGGIKTIRFSQFRRPPDSLFRIIIDVTEKTPYVVFKDQNRLVIAREDLTSESFREWRASAYYGASAIDFPTEPTVIGTTTTIITPDTTTTTTYIPVETGTTSVYIPPTTETITTTPTIVPYDDTAISIEDETIDGTLTKIVQPEIVFGYIEPKASIDYEFIKKLDLYEATLRNVVFYFAKLSGRNIILSSKVTSGTKVTIYLQDVTWIKAFDTIIKMLGLRYIVEDDIIRVVTDPEYTKSQEDIQSMVQIEDQMIGFQTVVIPIQFAKTSDVQPIITSMLSKQLSSDGRSASITEDKRNNGLVITDAPSNLERIKDMIEQLDIPIAQVNIEARIIEISTDASRTLGINWNVGGNLKWGMNIGNNPEPPIDLTSVPGNDDYINTNTNVPAPILASGLWGGNYGLSATLAALESENKASTLSRPNITVMANKSAKITSGTQVPYTKRDEAGNTVTEFVDIGITLDVTPYVNADNRVTLDLKVDVSSIKAAESGINAQFIKVTKNATTMVMVDNGATAVIGGLMKRDSAEGFQRLPFLSNLPLIGPALFQSRSILQTETEILIFITPRVILPPVKTNFMQDDF